MTVSRDPDRLVRAWLDLMPSDAPDRVVDSVLKAVETTPQARRPIGAAFRRPMQMNRFSYAAIAAALIVVVAGTAVALTRFTSAPIGASSPSPAASPAASASPNGALAAVLQKTWIGANRPISGAAGVVMVLGPDTLRIAQSNEVTASLLEAAASSDQNGRLVLRTSGVAGGCDASASGSYTYTLSASGRQLTLTATADDCSPRQQTVAGTWLLDGCLRTDEVCFGVMDAGTYGTQYFATHLSPSGLWTPAYGLLTFTVPDGWALTQDWPNGLRIATASEYATETAAGPSNQLAPAIDVVSHVGRLAASDPCGSEDSVGARSYADLVAYVKTLPGLIRSNEQTLAIGGLPAMSVDLRVARSWTTTCPGDAIASVPLLIDNERGVGEREISLYKPESGRLILVNTGTDVTAVLIHAPDAATFETFAPEATGIVQSFSFK